MTESQKHQHHNRVSLQVFQQSHTIAVPMQRTLTPYHYADISNRSRSDNSANS